VILKTLFNNLYDAGSGDHRRRAYPAAVAVAAGGSAGYNGPVTAMTAKVLFFGRLKEVVGVGEDLCEVPEGTSISRIFAQYAERWPRLAEFRGSVAASRNRDFAAWETPVEAGDEIGFLPPVSGG
jgi:molybdopterin synthase sulfur carrier subunit